MYNEKIDNLLNLSLNSTPEEFLRSPVLQVGFDSDTNIWEVIAKYSGSLSALKEKFPAIAYQELLFQYAILRIPENLIDQVAKDVQISFIEMPKNLFFSASSGLGQGVLIAIVDSGIDYAHPDFRNPDGTSRIVLLWDQTLGRVFDQQQLNQALKAPTVQERYRLVPSQDLSGHGTHVAGIAAGNGRASDGAYLGIAPEASLIVVKLGVQRPEAFPKTTELMSGVDFCLRQAYAMLMPIVINLSFGNNYGGHDGSSLLETYLENASSFWKSLIVTGTGNEGASNVHTQGRLLATSSVLPVQAETNIPFAVGEYNTGFNIQLWKNFVDEMEISIIGPSGENLGILSPSLGTQRFLTNQTDVLVYYGMPAPYSASQELFFDFIPQASYIESGIWNLRLRPIRIVDGTYHLWLPGQATLGAGSGFLNPTQEVTLTIPSTTAKVLSVGAYDARTLTMASFSGRGFTRITNLVKPDVVAPGVDIIAPSVGGGYTSRSGTSMAAPYASGKAALMMEEGIIKGNDPFLFGSKIIAYMHRLALPLPGYSVYPNPITGWGRI